MAKYCIWRETPAYGPRDEITGSRIKKMACFKNLRLARKREKELDRDTGWEECRYYLCRGAAFCGDWRDTSGRVGSKRAARAYAKAEARRQATTHRSTSDIPF
jgi:hypothetical protein